MITDNDLLLLLRNKPEQGLVKLINAYSGLVYTIVFSKLANSSAQDIEECVSDIMFEFYKNRDCIDLQRGSIKAYLSVIAKRRAIDYFRKINSPVKNISMDDARQGDIPAKNNIEVEIIHKEAKSILIKEIHALGEPDSEIIIRKYYFGQSTKSIAKLLHLKENTVDKKASRSLIKLRQSLGGVL